MDTSERPYQIEGFDPPAPATAPIEDDPVGVFLEEEHGNGIRREAAARLIVEMRDPPALRGERHLEVICAAQAYLRAVAEDDLAALERLVFGRAEAEGPRGARTAAANRARSATRLALAERARSMRAAGMRWKDIATALDRDALTLQRSIRGLRDAGSSSGGDESS